MQLESMIEEIAQSAQQASRSMSKISGEQKARALRNLADLLLKEQESIKEANAKDLKEAEASGLDSSRMDRLRLTDKIIASMADACREVAEMKDPVGGLEQMYKRPNGLLVGRMRIPLGVVAMIYEARPNVTIDAGSLCIMAGNAVILRGGKESFYSNQALAKIFSQALEQTGLPDKAVQLVPTTEREAVRALLKMEEYVDLVIPRGGEGLIKAVVQEAAMPVLKHYKGVCHIYVDEEVDLDQAAEIIYNAKIQRPSVCNALECLLVHEKVAERILPMLAQKMEPAGVVFRAEDKALPYLGAKAQKAEEQDFGQEFLDLNLAVKVVENQTEAQEHIARYGSNHTEVILTTNHDRAMRFVNEVDASMVGVNASTRFNDGGQLGLGAEIGISTSKLHAYGPMGVKELTTTKFVVLGQGQIRTS